MPLTHSQRQIWTGQQLAPDAPLYNTPFTFRFRGALDSDRFCRAFSRAIELCDALRTRLVVGEGGVPAMVLRDPGFILPVVDLSTEDDQEQALQAYIERESLRCFDLGGVLFDSALIRLGAEDHVWYFNQHHIVTDAWSTRVIYGLVDRCYRALEDGTTTGPLPAFEDYVAFERASSEGRNEAANDYWRAQASLLQEPPALYGRTNGDDNTASIRRGFHLGPARTAALREVAAEPGIRALTEDLSLFNVFSTLVFALLHRVTEGGPLSIGTPSHNRSTNAFKDSAGLFVELFPLVLSPAPEANFDDLLALAQEQSRNFLFHARPGSSVAAGGRAYNVVLNMITARFDPFGDLPTETVWQHPRHAEHSHHLRVTVQDFNATGDLAVSFDFNESVFPASRQREVMGHFERLLEAFLDDRSQPVRDVRLVSDEETEALLRTADGGSVPGVTGTLIEAFDEVVRAHPQRGAVRANAAALSYAELEAQSHAIAARLFEAGVEAGEIVGLLADRSVHAIAGMLGILRAGGAYLPLAPDNPGARTAFMQSDAGARFVVATSPVEGWSGSRVDPSTMAKDPTPVQRPQGPDDLAYLLYTSGSTGNPKGVLIEHRNVLTLVRGLHERVYAGLPDAQRVALLAPMTFDASVQQIFAALLGGHELHLVPEGVPQDGSALFAFFDEHGIDVSDGTPAHLALLARGAPEHAPELRVRHFVIGGQALRPETLGDFYGRFADSDPVVTNVYGPTECCVDSTSHAVTREQLQALGARTPLGKPMPGERVYVMSGSALQPIGAPGELVIAGAGVGRGYHGHASDLTAAFIEDPFQPGARAYRTGDMARLDDDGRLDFLGRRDNQVKVRGFRIELGEVEAAFRQVAVPAHDPLKLAPAREPVQRCVRCVLSAHYPGTSFDETGVCNHCRDFERHAEAAGHYFRPFSDLEDQLAHARETRGGDYDCLLLYSGGKDSSYVLHRLVEMGLKVLAYTFDNGFISPAAFRNIERQTSALGVESIVSKTPRMDAIFVESLEEDNTVCTGCFKALTTISTRLAADRGIPAVLTGLSRGQIYETKLEGLLASGMTETAAIDAQLRDFRRVYHAQKDRTSDLLGVTVDDVDLDRFQFIDFFRYDPTPTPDVKAYLSERDSFWATPEDTGFCSSNCMMNDIGICVHSQNRGYHNYEAPLSWDIRLGIAKRNDALAEVESPVDVDRVNSVLKKIGFLSKRVEDVVVATRQVSGGEDEALCAWYTSSQELTVSELREVLSERLPAYMIPQFFVAVPNIPLTAHGKTDFAALPDPLDIQPGEGEPLSPPEGLVEELIAEIWASVLGVPVKDAVTSFFEYGGASLQAMDVMLRIGKELGVELSLQELFRSPTVRALALLVERELDEVIAEIEAEDGA